MSNENRRKKIPKEFKSKKLVSNVENIERDFENVSLGVNIFIADSAGMQIKK